MASIILRPVWVRALGAFKDLITGDIITAWLAAPFLRAYPSVRGAKDVVIRDAIGRFVPSRFFGGQVRRHFPTGDGTIVAVTRDLPGNVEDWIFRRRDLMTGLVTYSVEGGPTEEFWLSMPKGMAYDQDIFEERFAKHLAYVLSEFDETPEIIVLPDYEIINVDWRVTIYYEEGEQLGEDVSRFGGVS